MCLQSIRVIIAKRFALTTPLRQPTIMGIGRIGIRHGKSIDRELDLLFGSFHEQGE